MVCSAVGLAVVVVIMIRDSRRERDDLRRREYAAQENSRRLEARWREVEDQRAAAVGSVAANQAGAVAAPGAAQTGRVSAAPFSLMEAAERNPQLWNEFIASKRAELQGMYVSLFQQLNLAPGQRDAFKAILAAGIARSTDIGAAANAQKLAQDDPAIVALRAEAQRQVDGELAALLGEAGLAAYQDYKRTIGVRGYVTGFAVQLALSEPLRPAQAEQLARVLIDASPSYRQGGDAKPGEVEWERVDRAAQEFLTPTQLVQWKLGVANNRYGGSRADVEVKKIYDDAVTQRGGKPGPDE